MATATTTTVNAMRCAAIVASLLVAASFVVAAAGEPDPDPERAISTTSIVECIMGCATKVMGCATDCAGKPSGDAPNCDAACVQSDIACLTGCGPAIGPSPPFA